MSMWKSCLMLCAVAILGVGPSRGADDPWKKVKELKTGSELHVYKRGAAQPLTVKIDELTDEARRDEIVSTPTFVFSGGFRLVGAQEYAVFASVTQRLIERRSGAKL